MTLEDLESHEEPIPPHPRWWDFPADPVKSDFRVLAYLVWAHMGMPDPTPAQYDIAYFLQHGWAGYGVDNKGNYFEWFGPDEVEPDRTGCTRLGDADAGCNWRPR